MADDEPKASCPDCGGDGTRWLPLMDDWDEIDQWIGVKCSFCGGTGWFYADTAAELKAEGVWYDNPSY